MATTTTISKGIAIEYKGQPWLVAEAQFTNPGKGSAFTKTKLKNLKTDQVIEITFKSGEALELIDTVRQKCQFLYKDGEGYNFMNNETYDQFTLDAGIIGDNERFMLENTDCYILFIDGKPISLQLPPKMDFKVTSTPPGVKGDTATGGSKEATIETGAVIKVPLFINEGETIKVNTDDGTYVSKA